jgi:hypothetical protein
MKNNKLKPTKDISPAIVKAMDEGYSLRKAISIVGLKSSKPKKK